MYPTQKPLMSLFPYTRPNARTIPKKKPAVIEIKVRRSVYPKPLIRFGSELRKN
jgi:hypothetical protein